MSVVSRVVHVVAVLLALALGLSLAGCVPNAGNDDIELTYEIDPSVPRY